MATMMSTSGGSLALTLRAAQAEHDAGLTLLVEPAFLELFPGERLHHADGGDRFLDDRGDLALLLLDGARGPFDVAGDAIDHDEQERRHRQPDQRKSPVEVEHDRQHADERQQMEHDAEHRRGDEVLGRVDVARQAHDHVAGLAMLVERQRQPLHVVVEQVPQVEPDALGHGGRQVLLRVGAHRADDGNRHHRKDGHVEDTQRIAPTDQPGPEARGSTGLSPSTWSKITLSGHGSSRSATPSTSIATNAIASRCQCGRSRRAMCRRVVATWAPPSGGGSVAASGGDAAGGGLLTRTCRREAAAPRPWPRTRRQRVDSAPILISRE